MPVVKNWRIYIGQLPSKAGGFFRRFFVNSEAKKLNIGGEKLNAPEAGQFFCLKTQLFGGQIFFSQINFITLETFS